MGGKNAVIVDEDADLDEAVHGVVASAFGYAGQKCSACPRDRVRGVRRVRGPRGGGDAQLSVGPADDPRGGGPGDRRGGEGASSTTSASARPRPARLRRRPGRTGGGWQFRRPARLCRRVARRATIAQEEIFGPVLSVIRAPTSTTRAHRQRHRTCSPAASSPARAASSGRSASSASATSTSTGRSPRLVDRQPFGGFKLSGSGREGGRARLPPAVHRRPDDHREHAPPAASRRSPATGRRRRRGVKRGDGMEGGGVVE